MKIRFYKVHPAKLFLVLMFCLFSIMYSSPVKSIKNCSFELLSESVSGMELTFNSGKIIIETVDINSASMQAFSAPGLLPMLQAGAPSLGGATRYVAIPQGARAEVVLLDYRTEVYQGVEVLPAPNIPFETDDAPLRYEKDRSIYGRDAYFPASPVLVSEPMQIRGVDVVIMNVTPFQCNPVTKELVVYKDLRFRLDFVGGNGRFGEDRLRSRFWEPILQGHLLNYASLPEIDFYAPERVNARDGWEYVIIVPNDPVFEAWADTIKAWRKLQGISCEVFTLTEVGGSSASAIEGFLNTAYATWDPAPVAFLILSDYPSSGDLYGVTSPIWNGYSVSDNIYSDVDGDDLPELHHGRICAQTGTQLGYMVNKFLSYERDPYVEYRFYDEPLIVAGWSSNSWLQISAEVVRGFFDYGLSKSPVHQYAIYSGSVYPGCPWSSAPNTSGIVQYFYSLGWLTDTLNPYDSNYWSNGSATGINSAINSGAFFVQHRSVGGETAWLYPEYTIADMSGLNNGMFAFVNSTSSLTGKYNWAEECFIERFHRTSHGALGANAAAEMCYSFVTDIYLWGMIDGMWPQFMPDYPGQRMQGYSDLRPCMAMTSGKYYLALPSWPYIAQQKANVYHLFHHHGDVFMTLYSEVPQSLAVIHDSVLPAGQDFFTISADDSSVIALTVDGDIIGVAEGTGYPVNVSVVPQSGGDTLKVTVTMANYYRYEADVPVVQVGVAEDDTPETPGSVTICSIYPNPFSKQTQIRCMIHDTDRTIQELTLNIYDAAGRLLKSFLLPNSYLLSSTSVVWDGGDVRGNACPSGVYFIELTTEDTNITKKLLLLR